MPGVVGTEGAAWANADTGARGAITAFAEYEQSGLLWRSFATTRERFDGVRLSKGNTCMAGAGDWHVQALRWCEGAG